MLALTLVAVCAAIVAIGHLQTASAQARDAQLRLTALRLDVAQIQDVPWGAAPGGDDPADVRDELQGDAQAIRQAIARLRARQQLPDGPAIDRPLNRSLAALWEIFRLVSHGHQDGTDAASETAARQAAATDRALQAAAARSRTHAAAMLARARYGSAAVILALFAAFAWVYLRALRARRSAERVALTDALTGLGNRRALTTGLQAAAGARMVALFDLDGFKQYNDTFGHPAGDALLARLGERLAGAVDGIGAAYRMGGDEFCVTASLAGDDPEAIAARAAAALSDEGDGYRITCSHGLACLPADTSDPDRALLLADRRMYQDKASGRPAPSYGMTKPPWRADLQTPTPQLPPAGSRTSPTR